MKKVLKVTLKVIIYLLIFTTLITGFVIVSRNNNQAKIDEELKEFFLKPLNDGINNFSKYLEYEAVIH